MNRGNRGYSQYTEVEVTETHIISGDAIPVRGRFRALCGRLVDAVSHQRDGDPTCPDCKRIDDEDTAHDKAQGWV